VTRRISIGGGSESHISVPPEGESRVKANVTPTTHSESTPLTVVKLRRNGGIQGDLSAYALPDLLQFLNSLRKCGQLVIERQKPVQSATLSFVEGRLVHAYCPPLQGEECLHYLLTWRTGRFIFLADAAPERETIRRDFRTVLLDAVRQHDEILQVLSSLPAPSTVFHRDRNQERLADITLNHLEWRVLGLIDGSTTLAGLLEEAPRHQLGVARALGQLLAKELITSSPSYEFLAMIVLRTVTRDIDLTGHPEPALAAAVLARCDGIRSLEDIRTELACSESSLIDVIEDLYRLLGVELVQGHAEYECYCSRI
jgi:hypothetical protein